MIQLKEQIKLRYNNLHKHEEEEEEKSSENSQDSI